MYCVKSDRGAQKDQKAVPNLPKFSTTPVSPTTRETVLGIEGSLGVQCAVRKAAGS